jgi:hypothetical protein
MLALSTATHADTVINLGVNPTSGAGAFANTNPGTGGGGSGLFGDTYDFQLIGGPQFLTIASVTNVFASPNQFITNLTGSVVSDGPNGVRGGGDDFAVIGPVAATIGCGPIPNCQGFAGAALLNPGGYYLLITGNAAADSGYGGNLSVAPVPSPIVGAGLPGLIAGFGSLLGWVSWKRRRRLNGGVPA